MQYFLNLIVWYIPYLFEYKTQNFELIFNQKLRVRPINELKCLINAWNNFYSKIKGGSYKRVRLVFE